MTFSTMILVAIVKFGLDTTSLVRYAVAVESPGESTHVSTDDEIYEVCRRR